MSALVVRALLAVETVLTVLADVEEDPCNIRNIRRVSWGPVIHLARLLRLDDVDEYVDGRLGIRRSFAISAERK